MIEDLLKRAFGDDVKITTVASGDADDFLSKVRAAIDSASEGGEGGSTPEDNNSRFSRLKAAAGAISPEEALQRAKMWTLAAQDCSHKECEERGHSQAVLWIDIHNAMVSLGQAQLHALAAAAEQVYKRSFARAEAAGSHGNSAAVIARAAQDHYLRGYGAVLDGKGNVVELLSTEDFDKAWDAVQPKAEEPVSGNEAPAVD